jgi:hypothetical protein
VSLTGTFLVVGAKIAQNEKKINTFLTRIPIPLDCWLKFGGKALLQPDFSTLL